MTKFHRMILAYCLLSLIVFWDLAFFNAIIAMEEHKVHGPFTPAKKGIKSYGGLEHRKGIETVKMSSCVSLGGSCIEKINDVLKTADQFVVSFMYRFNSPALIKTLENKYLASIPVITFLDYNQTYKSSSEGSHYPNYVRRLIESAPTSLVKLGSRSFHQKVIISKKLGEQAVIILGSANATFEADNEHSEDVIFIQSNALANMYLEEFKNLMRMEPIKKLQESELQESDFHEQQVKIFHEHRVLPGKSNIEYLDILRKKLNPDLFSKDKSTLVEGHLGDIVSLAISTGFPDDGGTQNCLNIVNTALGDHDNEFLFLFENYISLHDTSVTEEIWKNLQNQTPKLIVLDKNKHNVAALNGEYELLLISELPKNKIPLKGKMYLEKDNTGKLEYTIMTPDGPFKGTLNINVKKLTYPVLNTLKSQILKEVPNLTSKGLKTDHNHVFLFKPFSGGKFHHKLIIQYPQHGDPIVYTGSFHISTNAIQKNSENIIGVRSVDLADEYLASILLNSGLGEDPRTWQFISKYPRLRLKKNHQESMVLQAARRLSQKCKTNMDRYLDRLERIENDIQLAASNADHQIEVRKYFSHYVSEFQSGDEHGKLEAIENLIEAVFKGTIPKIYLPHLKEKWKSIKKKIDDVEDLPDFEMLTASQWLEEMSGWIENTKGEAKGESINITEEIESIATIYVALNDLSEYEATFGRLYELHEILDQLLKK